MNLHTQLSKIGQIKPYVYLKKELHMNDSIWMSEKLKGKKLLIYLKIRITEIEQRDFLSAGRLPRWVQWPVKRQTKTRCQ